MRLRLYLVGLFYLSGLFICNNLVYSSSTVGEQAFGDVTGKIINLQQEPVFPAVIKIDSLAIGVHNNERGIYTLKEVPAGKHILTVSGVGFKTTKVNVSILANKSNQIKDIVIDENHELSEVMVIGKTEKRKIQELAFAVGVLDFSESYHTSADVATLTNRITGVRIREEGGVGSGYSFSLNGFSGKQIKFFLDGLPIDNFGVSFGLNNLPVNMVERVEVYKGVIPVVLGADALGGAVNIVSRKTPNYLDVSYSIGSFNTHKFSINGAFTTKSGFTTRINSFLNYSDNDYKVYVPIIDLTTRQKTGNQWVKRFHDQYQSAGIRLEAGLVNKSYADYLLAGIIVSENEKDIQNGVVMDNVYGARTANSQSLIPTLRYKKTNLFADRLDLSFYGSYIDVNDHSIDTVPRTYNWLGDWRHNDSEHSGERQRSQLDITTRQWQTNTTIDYTFNPHHSISLNHLFSTEERKASDIEDPANQYNQIPQSVDKQMIGLGWIGKYKKWNATLFGKLFRMTGETYQTNLYTTGLTHVSIDYTKLGYGAAATYFILPKMQAKLSYEHTYRLPEAYEMFGDNQENSRNAGLKPESSNNVNLGIIYELDFPEDNVLQIESNFLFRDSRDFIHKELKQPSMMYVNIGKVRTTGTELSMKYSWKHMIHAGANFTYQYIIDNSKTTPSQTVGGVENENFNYEVQLPNIPYLFGNLSLGYSKHNLLIKNSAFTIDYFLNYVKDYYLSWPTLGLRETKDVIPQQLSHNIAFGYSLQNGRYNISFECNNFTDEALYDNFKLQKPGRFFYAKFRYYLGK